MQKVRIAVLAFIIFALAVAAVKTVIPNAQASKACLLGYRAACSFTPISTAVLVVADIVVVFILKGLITG